MSGMNTEKEKRARPNKLVLKIGEMMEEGMPEGEELRYEEVAKKLFKGWTR